jgi:hypothetical protein
MKLHTWHVELLVVGTILSAVNVILKRGTLEWVGALAVLVSFAHGQVSDRLAEKEGQKSSPEVDCYRMSRRYFVAKEVLWVLYFVMSGAWSPLIGCGLFLVYPIWRSWWRKPPH